MMEVENGFSEAGGGDGDVVSVNEEGTDDRVDDDNHDNDDNDGTEE